MSTGLGLGSGSDPLTIGGDPFGGATPFGFQVPQGDPGAIEAAAGRCRTLGEAVLTQGRALRLGATMALDTDGGWKGSAAGAYAEYAGHVVSTSAANVSAFDDAATALQTLSRELTEAQAITKQALADCERAQTELGHQQQAETTAAQDAQTAEQGLATAVHPGARASLQKAADTARGQQQAAATAAGMAEGELKAAQRRGQSAYERYEQAARAASNRLESAAGQLRPPALLGGGVPVPVSVSPSDVVVAGTVMRAAGGLDGTAEALGDPSRLRALSCGDVTPGTVLQLLKDYDDKQAAERAAAADRPEVDKVLDWIGHQSGQLGQGAWDNVKGVANAVTHPGQTLESILGTSPAYREFVQGENPVQAQAAAQQQGEQNLDDLLDTSDWSHGDYARALGNDLMSVVEVAGPAKAGDAAGAASRAAGSVRDAAADTVHDIVTNPGTRGAAVKAVFEGAGHAGVPHAGDVSDLAGEAASHSLAAYRDGVVSTLKSEGLTPQLSARSLPVADNPRVVVASRPEPAYRPPDVVRNLRPRGAPRGR